ncbi:lipid-A-disaccharide synthase [Hymenobacter sp. DG25B]|jgi:lipid-A-disaccharide synthase|uniref:lipid-A-disaccharide synthase n=1 Tax=Hymenobacter sp. DG25B TaxID=1385664 RepID=UPI000540B135|nr:lipid-A-disaccharide synthase [Hymenobacter sp. DG25B]AIZ64405.1 lipid-A-disaccharide synthase [Hymenobacter sp. DG25B]
MKYYLIAGERSGDMHAANLMRELKQQDPQAEFRAWGGDMMAAQGAELVHHYQEMAIMGFLEAATSLLKFRGYLKECERDLLAYKPDVVILVDYGGFNMRVAKFAKAAGLKVFYYISPKIWAWNQSRGHKIKQLVDRMFVILPFEQEFYKRFEYKVDYIGNPTADVVADHQPSPDFYQRNNLDPNRPIIAVLPGSRKQEIEEMLFEMTAIIPPFMDYQFLVAGVDNLDANYYANFERNNVRILFNQTYDILSHAKAAMVTSGTATLETALFDVPQVVCYRTSAVSYVISKAVIKVPYISLVNLIAEKEVVKELIQGEFNSRKLVQELKKITADEVFIARQKADYAELREKLGRNNSAKKAAELMVGYLQN